MDAWSIESPMAEEPDLQQGWDDLDALYAQALQVLEELDRLGLYQAGAHLSMAIEAMRQRHPNLPPPA
jgi:hypothetical protein